MTTKKNKKKYRIVIKGNTYYYRDEFKAQQFFWNATKKYWYRYTTTLEDTQIIKEYFSHKRNLEIKII